jgi:hypothetical protein
MRLGSIKLMSDKMIYDWKCAARYILATAIVKNYQKKGYDL